jgi:hypothetical protein
VLTNNVSFGKMYVDKRLKKEDDMKKDMKKEGFGWCDYHEDYIDEYTYEWKGCWHCHYFTSGRDFPYTFVNELAEEFKVTPQTIRRWIRTGKLKGRLFIQKRKTNRHPAPRTYHIEKGQNPIR